MFQFPLPLCVELKTSLPPIFLVSGVVLALFPWLLRGEDKQAQDHKQNVIRLMDEVLPKQAKARLGTLAFRNDHSINSVDWSPDGQTIACAGNNRRVRLFDLHGRELPFSVSA